MMEKLSRVFVLLALVTASMPAGAQFSSQVTHFTLENGLQAVIIPDRRAPVATHTMWYKVGAADEEPGKSGIAHFFEHLMFKATANHPSGAFSDAVAAIGGYDNAFTTWDYTAYVQQVDPSALRQMMEFEADRMTNLVLDDEAVKTERDVILEERASRIDNDPGGLLNEEAMATFFQNHPYRIPVIGWRHEIAGLNTKDATDFYRRYYAPNNAIVIVAGDVDPAAVRADIEAVYGSIPRGPDLPRRERPKEPEQESARTISLSDPRITQPSISRMWLVPAYGVAPPGEAEAVDILAEILGGAPRGRIYQELVVKKGNVQSAGAYMQNSLRDYAIFGVFASPRNGEPVDGLLDDVIGELRRVADEGVTGEELESARNRFLRAAIFAQDSQTGMVNIYGRALAADFTLDDIDEWPDAIRSVTPEMVRDAARRILATPAHVTRKLLPPEGASQ